VALRKWNKTQVLISSQLKWNQLFETKKKENCQNLIKKLPKFDQKNQNITKQNKR